LALLVEESHRLKELDISWNIGVRPKFYLPLLDALGENRALTSVNLSYNSLIDAPEIELPQRKNTTKMRKTGMNRTGKVAPEEEKPLEFWETDVKYSANSLKILNNLMGIIKRNKNMQHLNLTSVGLTERMLVDVGSSLTRAKSLLSVHLCGNKGVTDRLKQYLEKRIRCKSLEPKYSMK
jgi:hypothetical protein